jgi:MFS transporter, MHS family, proline/betaine transporter
MTFKSIIKSSIGNSLEWYDFGLFTIFSSIFSRLFFPSQHPEVSLIATFSVFTVGFICRPLGALIFGFIGDTYGRAKTLKISMIMIAIPTFMIALIPSYQTIGILAPIFLVIIRICQGISIGGEYSGNLIYLAESAPKNYRATITSFATASANIGILAATLVGMLLSYTLDEQTLFAYGWRIPYFISGLICFYIFYTRLNIAETKTFNDLKGKKLLVKNPIKAVFKYNSNEILKTIGLVCMGSTFYFYCFVYIPIYLSNNLHYSIAKISSLMSILTALMIILVPLAGWLCDKLGRRKMFLLNVSLVVIFTIPGFYFLQAKDFFLIAMILLGYTIVSSLEQGVTAVTAIEHFPSQTRYSGIAIGYNLGNGLLGGTVPFICEWLVLKTNYNLAPAIYIALCGLVTGIVVYFCVTETGNRTMLSSSHKLGN